MRVSPVDFRIQMEYVARHYNTVTLSQIWHSRSAQPSIPPYSCAITFDDGYMDVYENAVPVLQELGLKATFFVIARPTAFQEHPWLHAMEEILDANSASQCAAAFRRIAPAFFPAGGLNRKVLRQLVWRYFLGHDRSTRQRFLHLVQDILPPKTSAIYRFMDGDHIKQLYEKGFEIGCHTMEHEYITLMDSDELADDLRRCQEFFRGLMGVVPNGFCCPFGASNQSAMDVLKREGFAYACTTEPGFNDSSSNPYALYRIGVYADTSVSRFVCQLAGVEGGLRSLCRAIRGIVQKGN